MNLIELIANIVCIRIDTCHNQKVSVMQKPSKHSQKTVSKGHDSQKMHLYTGTLGLLINIYVKYEQFMKFTLEGVDDAELWTSARPHTSVEIITLYLFQE